MKEDLYSVWYTYGASTHYLQASIPLSWPAANRWMENAIQDDRNFFPRHGHSNSRIYWIFPAGATPELLQARADLLKAFHTHLPAVWQAVANDTERFPTFSLDEPGQIAYASITKDRYNIDRRVRTSIGRYLSRRLKITVDRETQLAIEKIACIGGYDPGGFKIRRDVSKVYAWMDRGATHSCMSTNPNNCLSLYENNDVPVLVYGDYTARALLWTLADGRKFLDRIYPNDGPHIAHYKQYCIDNDIIMRAHQRLPDGHNWEVPGDETLYVEIDCSGQMPYMDTFGYGSCGLDMLASRGSSGFPHVFHGTDGLSINDDDNDNEIRCERCGDWFDPDGENYGEVEGSIVCEGCFENAYFCDRCDCPFFSDSYTVDNEETWCGGCVEYAAHSCSECGEYVTDARLVDGKFYCEGCAEESNTCTTCGRETFDNGQEIDGEYHCDGCASDAETCVSCERETFKGQEIDGDFYCDNCITDMTPDSMIDRFSRMV